MGPTAHPSNAMAVQQSTEAVLAEASLPNARDTSADNTGPSDQAGPSPEAHNPPPQSQPLENSKGVSPQAPASKWDYYEERYFYEYLRMVKGSKEREKVISDIANVLFSKSVDQVAAYYEQTLSNLHQKLGKDQFEKRTRTIENIHYMMLVYWEKFRLPERERKHERAKSKDSKGNTAKKSQLRSDAAGQSTKKKKSIKNKTAGSAPGNGTSNTPTQSICLEEQQQQNKPEVDEVVAATDNNKNKNKAVDVEPHKLEAAAVASCGTLPVQFVNLRLHAATEIHSVILFQGGYSNSITLSLPAHTRVVDMLLQLGKNLEKVIPAPLLSSLCIHPGPNANMALKGFFWGGPKCNPDLTIGDIVGLMPMSTPEEPTQLMFSWNATAAIVAARAAKARLEYLEREKAARQPAAPALKDEDPHESLKRAIRATIRCVRTPKKERGVKVVQKNASAPVAAMAPPPKQQTSSPAPAQVAPVPVPVAYTTPVGAATAGAASPENAQTDAANTAPAAAPGPMMQMLLQETKDAADIAINQPSSKVVPDPNKCTNSDVDMTAIAERKRSRTQVVEEAQGGIEDEEPAQKSRVPIGLRNLLKNPPPPPKKSPKKKAKAPSKQRQNAMTRRKAAAMAAAAQETAEAPESMPVPLNTVAPALMVDCPSQLQPQHMVAGMPLPAGMASYLGWQQQQQPSQLQAQGQAQVLQAPYMTPQQIWQAQQQYAQQQAYAAAAAAAAQHAQLQQQSTPPLLLDNASLDMSLLQAPVSHLGISNLGDSLFGALFEASRPPVQIPQPHQMQVMLPAAAPVPQQQQAVEGTPDTYCTPGKGQKPTPGSMTDGHTGAGGDSILKLPAETWASLSPPPNFKLPPELLGEGGSSPLSRLGAGVSLLPTTSLLGFMDAHPKVQGVAATAMQKGVEALFQQVAGGGSNATATAAAGAEHIVGASAPRGGSLQGSLLASLLGDKSNSDWMAAFEMAQSGGNSDKKKSPEPAQPVGERPFAALFGA